MNIYKVGDIVEGMVSGVSEYGAFVNIDNTYSGLIHISEVSNHYVKNILDYVSVGENILCEILEVDNEKKQSKQK